MAYRSAVEGQIVYIERQTKFAIWCDQVVFSHYFKSDPDLVHPNSAVIRDNGLPIIVSIKNLYKESF